MRTGGIDTYQLLLKGDLLELHPVQLGLSGSEQPGGCDTRALHDGQRPSR